MRAPLKTALASWAPSINIIIIIIIIIIITTILLIINLYVCSTYSRLCPKKNSRVPAGALNL